MKKNMLLLATLVFSLASFGASAATWTEFKRVTTIQTYGGSFQVWLEGTVCPNAKPYFSVDGSVITELDRLLSMILMAKASQTRIKFQFDVESNPSFCYVTGLQME